MGVRNIKTGALMGCITAVPADVRVYDTVQPMVEINFLCVHKKLRYACPFGFLACSSPTLTADPPAKPRLSFP